LWTALVLIFAVTALQGAARPTHAPDEIIVRFKASVPAATQGLSAASFSSLPSGAAQALSSVNATQLIPLKSPRLFRPTGFSSVVATAFEPLGRTYRVRLPAGADVGAAIARISANASVELAEPNQIYRLSQLPNDPSFGLQWAYRNTGQSGSLDGFDPATGIAGVDLDAAIAWDATTGSAATVVAVIDSGLEITHPDIAANVYLNPGETNNGLDDDSNLLPDDLRGWDFGDDDNVVAHGCPDNGHGTHVAGAVGAIGNNGTGVTGMNWNVKLMPLKVSKSDSFCTILTSDIVDAVAYATNKGAKVINMSLGGPDSTTLHTAVDAAKLAGVVLVAAAGNESTSSPVGSYPAAYASVIGVAATDRRDARASFSNFGSWVSLAAPGAAIYSTLPFADGSYGTLSGTSMASPLVAGIAALVRSQYPLLTSQEVENRLLASCENILATGIGAGRINASRALLSVTGVSPVVVDAGRTTALTLTGVALQSGMTVRLVRNGALSITATGLNVTAQNSATCNVAAPVTSTGVYSVQVTIGQTEVTLPNAITIVGLSVTSVSPTHAPTGATASGVALTGQNFDASMLVALRRTGQADVAATNLTVNTPTSATVDLNLSGAAGGRWDVVSTSGAFVATLANGFAVTTPSYQVVSPAVATASQFSVSLPQGPLILNWPAGATATPIDIDINLAPTFPFIDSSRDPFAATGVAVDLSLAGSPATFGSSFRITLPFQLSDIPDPAKLSALSIAYYNTATRRWEPIKNISVDTAAGTVSGSANHFSVFQIVQHVPSANLDRAVAFPNPFRPDRGHDRIIFDFLSAGSTVKIFDVSGALVRELNDDDGDGRIDWMGATNDDGKKIASGVYYYVVAGAGGKKAGRVAVVR